MSRKFIVGVSGMSSECKTKFKEFLRSEKFGWWHWIDDMWILSGGGGMNVSEIRDKLIALDGDINAVVIEFDPVTWGTFGPERDGKSFSKWLKENLS